MTHLLTRRSLLGAAPLLAGGLSLAGLPDRASAQAFGQGAAGARPTRAMARLAGNENPYGPGPAARAAIAAATGDSWKYPIMEEMAFRAQLAEREGLSPREVLVGEGSSEILHIAALLAGIDGGEVLSATPTFDLVAVQARAAGAVVRELPLDAQMRFDLPALRAAVGPQTRLIYICNPNNPTGTMLPGTELRAFIESLPPAVTVLVDEAYLELAADMASESMATLVHKGANVVVARTFSKLHGLAGLRIGYALARADLIERMARLKLSSTGFLGVAAAAASYTDMQFQAESRSRIAEGVAITTAVLDELGRAHAPTWGNFVFFDTGGPAREFIAAMREAGFSLGRPFAAYPNWCRVSMGTVAQMQDFAAALRRHFG